MSLTQRIGRSTGGVGMSVTVMTKRSAAARRRAVPRGKAVPDKTGELFAIMHDVLTSARLDNRERIRQMVLEAKAGFESRLAGAGNGIVAQRLRAQSNESDWAGEQMGGISHYFYFKELAKRIDSDWPAVQADLETIRNELLHRGGMIANVTADAATIDALTPQLAVFLAGLPEGRAGGSGWGFVPQAANEGLTFPGQVNYVAKGANLIDLGFVPTGGTAVPCGTSTPPTCGTGCACRAAPMAARRASTAIPAASPSPPTAIRTCSARSTTMTGRPRILRAGVGEQELTRSIIGVIGAIDAYRLPDAKGFTSLMFELTGETEETRQQRRDEVLGASNRDFTALADALDAVARQGKVVVLAPKRPSRPPTTNAAAS